MPKTTEAIDLNADMIDIRDVIARVEFLEEVTGEHDEETRHEQEILEGLLSDLKGYGGDEQWRGDWYPIALIRDSYFKTYAQDLAEDIGAIDRNARWPNTCIDWDKAARELQTDYSTVELDGTTYWYR